MKRLALAAVAVVALAGLQTATAAQTHPDTPRHGATIEAPPVPSAECLAPNFDRFARWAWDLDRWRHPRPSAVAVKDLHHRLECAPNAAHRGAMLRKWTLARARLGEYRTYRGVAVYRGTCNGTARGPGDGCWWSISACTIEHESGGSFTIVNSSSGAGGAYQALESTWLEMGGGRYAPRAELASPLAQHIIGARILAAQGPGAWTAWC